MSERESHRKVKMEKEEHGKKENKDEKHKRHGSESATLGKDLSKSSESPVARSHTPSLTYESQLESPR